MGRLGRAALAAACLVLAPAAAAAPAPALRPSMEAEAWTAEPTAPWTPGAAGAVKSARYEGMAGGVLTLNEGLAASRDARFSEGEVEFDIKPLEYGDTGVILRRSTDGDGEFVYLRANPDCPAADDCVQYAPITHGLMQWDIYPDHQASAAVTMNAWNHLRVRVVADSLSVFLNRGTEPVLVVPRLQGLNPGGGIAFKGPALFANLVVRPAAPAAPATPTPPAFEPEVLHDWSAAPPTERAAGRPVQAADAPTAAWRPIAAEPNGLVNLSRLFGSGAAARTRVAWLRTTVDAPAAQRRVLRLGFARQAWLFLDGRLVYAGDNPYYPDSARLSVDGRLKADDAVVPLDLRPGSHELLLAVGDEWRTSTGALKPSPYGWGAQAHLGPPLPPARR